MVNRKHLILIMSVVAAASVCGCTEDSRFDYENISSNLKNEEITLFQNGISIPVGSTKEMRLDSIIAKAKSDELNKYLRIKPDGTYALEIDGEYDFDNILGSFNVSDMATLNAVNGSFTFTKQLSASGIQDYGLGEVTIPEVKFDINLQKDLAAQLKLDVPDMIVAIGDIQSTDQIHIDFALSEEGIPTGINYLDLDLKLTLPSIFVPNEFTIKDRMTVTNNKGEYKKVLNVEKLDFSALDLADVRAGTLPNCGMSLVGTLYSKNVTLNPAKLNCDLNGKMTFSVADKSGDLSFNQITAKINYQKDTTLYVNAINFDFPEIISEFKADFPSIEATTELSANCSIPLTLDLDAYLVNGTTTDTSNPLFKESFEVPYSQDGTVATNTKKFNIDINNLFNNEPDSLQFKVLAKSDPTRWTKISSEMNYNLKAKYGLEAPLKFGTEFKIELKDTIDLDSSMSPILEKNPVCIKAKAENTLPLGIKLNLSLLCKDESGAQSVQNTAITGNLDIKAGTTSDLDITLKAGAIPAGQTIKGLIFVATATSNGQNLKPENYIKFNSISLKLPEGITYNLNSNNE